MKNKVIYYLLALGFFFVLNDHAHASDTFRKAETVELNNGIKVFLQQDNSNPIVSVQVWVKVGSLNENSSQKGLTHFLEHLLFKGSDNYPGDMMSRKVEANGGMINAGTSKDYTLYHIDTPKEGAEEAVIMLADAVFNATLPEKEIEKERKVVIEEISRHDDNPGAVLFDLFSEALFSQTPYKFSVIGSSEVISSVKKDAIQSYYKTWYVPDNMIISIVGDFDKTQLLKVVESSFGTLTIQPLPASPNLFEASTAEKTLTAAKKVEHAYMLSGFIGPRIDSVDQFAAEVAATVLGGGKSSRLYQILREKKQLVFSIYSSYYSQRGNGIFFINSVCQPEKRSEVINEISSEIVVLAEKGPDAAELARAKEILRSEWYFNLETFHAKAALTGYWNLAGYPELPEIYIKKIESVTAADISNFFKKYGKFLSHALLLPEDNEK